MKPAVFLLVLLCAVALHPAAFAAPRAKQHELVRPPRPIAAGQRVPLQVAPPIPGLAMSAPRGAGVRPTPQFRYAWQVVSGPGSVSLDGVYLAPYVIAKGEEEVRIELLVKNDSGKLDTLVRGRLQLAPGVYPGADSCLGAGQTFEDGGYEMTELDELPEPVNRVAAEYPPKARARRAQANFVVRAIVCRNGQVLDGSVIWPVDAVPDRDLERAALDAARQWTFTPGTRGGQPMATVVDIPFVFKP